MGSFFSNVQVHRGSHPANDVRATVVEALRKLVLTGGYVETDTADLAAARVIVVGPANESDWVAVYDSAMESQDTLALDTLAGALSTATETAAVAVLVHDSDILDLRLWRSGHLADMYSSCPDYFGRVSRAQRRALSGQPEQWRDLLTAQAIPADLRTAWDEPLLFAEATLGRTAELLGLQPEACRTGLRYLLRSAANAAISLADAGYTLMTFRTREPEAVAEPASTAKLAPSGPPTLSVQSGGGGATYSAGDPLCWVDCAVGNSAGAGVGLQVVVWGSALDRRLITLEAVEISLPPVDETTELTWERHAPVAVPAGKGVAHVLRLEAYTLLGDTAGWGDTFSNSNWHSPHDAIRTRTTRHVHVRLHGMAQAEGSGELHVGFVPLENPQDGQTSYTFPIVVTRRPRRPLRCAPDDEASGQFLRDLDDPRVLVALVALGCDRAVAGQVAADAITDWTAAIGPAGGRYEGFVHDRFDYRPRRLRVPVASGPGGAEWQRLREMLAQAVLVKGELRAPKARSRPNHTSGFLFEADSLFMQHGGDRAAPQLLLWADTRGRDDESISSLRDTLMALVSRVMAQGDGLQALVARWNWSTYYQGSAQATPYEMASGVHGQVTTGRAWCSRWLRGVAERLWLGAGLAAQLGGDEVLRSVADVNAGDGVLALLVRPGATLDTLEQVLAPILPGEADWHRGMDMLYGRDKRGEASASDVAGEV